MVRDAPQACGAPHHEVSSPPFAHWSAAKHFGDARARGGRSIVRQRIEREESVGNDFVVGFRDSRLAERVHYEKRNVVAPGNPHVEEHAMKMRWLCQLDISLFEQLARQRLAQRLACLHPAARQVPPADITVLDEKDAALVIDDESANAQCHGAGKAPIEVHDPSDCGFEPLARSRKTHVRRSCSYAPFAFSL
jgi:hypothetical protein